MAKDTSTKSTESTGHEAPASTVPGGGGLTIDDYAADRAVTEKAQKSQEQWDEVHAAPDEVFTPEQKKAMKEGEKAQKEEEEARQAKVDLAENPGSATDQTTSAEG